MKQRTFNISVLVLMVLAGGLHLLRVVVGWSLVINDFAVPMWVSGAVVVVLAYLIYSGAMLKR